MADLPRAAAACAAPTAAAIGLAAALAFVALTTLRLEAQGPQYDELHQAPAAFTHLGARVPMFALVRVGGYPLLNLPYSGALKSHFYGLYLRFSGAGFGLASWRWTGILLAAAGILLFCLLARAALPAWALALFCALLLTDRNLLVQGRFDWGPVDLALLLRLGLVGVWLRAEASERASRRAPFALGLFVGIAAFEKLSSCVLVLPLAAMLLLSRRWRTPAHLVSAAAGLAAGLLPLAAVNLARFLAQGSFVSLSDLGTQLAHPNAFLLGHTRSYASLGRGDAAAKLILGLPVDGAAQTREALLLVAALLAVLMTIARRWRAAPAARWAAAAAAGYVGVWLALPLLPRLTSVHHWIIGTPFQYAAVVLALVAWRRPRAAAPATKAAVIAMATVTALWLGARVPGVVQLERALARGSASRQWDPSLAAIGRFAAARAGEAVFIASGWGVGTQIYCFANAREGLLHEPFWKYKGPAQLVAIARRSPTGILYLARLQPPAPVLPQNTRRIERDLAADPLFRELPVEPEVARLAAVLVRKFAFTPRLRTAAGVGRIDVRTPGAPPITPAGRTPAPRGRSAGPRP